MFVLFYLHMRNRINVCVRQREREMCLMQMVINSCEAQLLVNVGVNHVVLMLM